jgi:deoxyadenosine/deoxycytidine kinase
MSEMEISIYDSWFNPVVSELPGLVPDAFIYLRASTDTCLQRLHSRKRQAPKYVHAFLFLLNAEIIPFFSSFFPFLLSFQSYSVDVAFGIH